MVAVDSAQKRRERTQRWALRNIKLRLSRKLIFVAGFWACLSCRLNPSDDLKASREKGDREGVLGDMTDLLFDFCQRSPLETLASAFMKYKAWDAATKSFGAYENFLKILNDPDQRKQLEDLKHTEAVSNAAFKRAKEVAEEFQKGLELLFFHKDADLTSFSQTDGVF